MLKKLLFKPGVNKENTRYTNEGGWYESEKIRFRQGTPEKIGGWIQISANKFLGICRSLWNWITLGSQNLIGIGTNLKFYISDGGAYYDVTPIRSEATLVNKLTTDTTTNSGGYTTVTVTDINSGFLNNDFVTLYGSAGNISFNGITITSGTEYQLTYVNNTSYTIRVAGTATSSSTGGGTVYAVYQVNTGPQYAVPLTGWGAGAWGTGTWGVGSTSTDSLRLWNQFNFGEDLIFGPSAGPLYYWDASIGLTQSSISISNASPAVVTSTISLPNGQAITLNTTGALPTGLLPGITYYVINSTGTSFNLSLTAGGTAINTSSAGSGTQYVSVRGVPVSSLNGANSVPLTQNYFLVSDQSRFVICFGTNDYGSTTINPMLVRWSDQESVVEWAPSATTQAGSIALSHGSKIVTAVQSRQEIVIFTDSSLYSMQYLGAPAVWGFQLLADNMSIANQNAAIVAGGAVYWMGVDKFYKYDGRFQTLNCDLRQFVFENINKAQFGQVFAGTNEGFNEVWWFYCTGSSNIVDSYVIFNYAENEGQGAWYYGTLGRTAWLDSGTQNYPIAATYSNNIVQHENGVDDCTDSVNGTAIDSYIVSSQFDIEDGHKFGFVWRMLPDLKFNGSTTTSPAPYITMSLLPLQNSGSGYNNPLSVGGSAEANVTRVGNYDVDQYTGQIYTRVRGRQMSLKVRGNQKGLQWQLGAPRIDIRADGNR